MKTTRVENMTSSRGNKIANQFIIYTSDGCYFQSYKSIIAFIPNGGGKTQLDSYYWDYSVTTGKYHNQFLGETEAETQRKIDSSVYELVDLNNRS